MVLLGRRLAESLDDVPRRFAVAEWLKTSAPMALVDGCLVLINAVDVLMVGARADPRAVGVYFATVKTLALVHFVYYAAKVGSAKRFASLWHAGDQAGLAAFVATVGRWTFWASVAMAAILLVVGKPLLALFGPGFADGWGILAVLMIGALARASVGPAETLLTMAGQQTASAAVYGATLAIAFLATAGLVPLFGIWGAAVGMTGAMVFEAIVLALAVRRRLGIATFVFSAPVASGADNEGGRTE
jgi:O-antigen/teichoic acid export membrane protein